jgi:membrane associated rhomboid family serine protease
MLPLHDDNEAHSPPIFTILFILINILMFIVSVSAPEGYSAYIKTHGTVPFRFIHNFGTTELFNCLTSMFLHGGLAHLLGNLWFLWIFGDNVEDELGHFNFIFFYIICGYFADLAHIMMNPGSTVPTIGASGAISGVLASYVMLHPNAQVKTWIGSYWVTHLPAWTFIGIWFGMQCLWGYFDQTSSSGTAWFAHIGGFVAGLLFTPMLVNRNKTHQPASYETTRYY